MSARRELATAWSARAERIAAEIAQAERAPAFFKPEYVTERRERLASALRWARFWGAQA